MPNQHLHLVLSGQYTPLDQLLDEAESLAGQTVTLSRAAEQAMDILHQQAGYLPWREHPIDAYYHRQTGFLVIEVGQSIALIDPVDWMLYGAGLDSFECRNTPPPWEKDDVGDGEDEEVHDAGE